MHHEYTWESYSIDSLKGKTLASIEGAEPGSDRIVFTTTDGESFIMFHRQDCCECVSVTEVIGDIRDLIGNPLLEAEEASTDDAEKLEYEYSYTWTFYKLGTIKGFVTLRWLGTSNGYYSESVDFEKVLN